MSTRAWYDYYVIAPDTGMLSLAMRFYKWGDGTPENALEEYVLLQGRLHQHSNRLPVEWLDRLLRKQLGNPGCIELCERDGTDVLTTLPDTTAHPDDNAWQRKQLDLAIPTIDSADSTAWLNTLHEKVPPALIEAAQRTRELAQQTRRE